MKLDELTNTIIGLAIKIHRQFGPGLLESVYQAALAYELQKANIKFEKEKGLPVRCSWRFWVRINRMIPDFDYFGQQYHRHSGNSLLIKAEK